MSAPRPGTPTWRRMLREVANARRTMRRLGFSQADIRDECERIRARHSHRSQT